MNEFKIGRTSYHPVPLGNTLKSRSPNSNTCIYTFGIIVGELPNDTFDVTITLALENGRLLLKGGEKWVAFPEVPGAGDVLFAFGIKQVIVSACIEAVTARLSPPAKPPQIKVIRTVFRYGKHRIEGDPKPGMAYVIEHGPGSFYVEEWHSGTESPYTVAGPLDETNARAALAARHTTRDTPNGE